MNHCDCTSTSGSGWEPQLHRKKGNATFGSFLKRLIRSHCLLVLLPTFELVGPLQSRQTAKEDALYTPSSSKFHENRWLDREEELSMVPWKKKSLTVKDPTFIRHYRIHMGALHKLTVNQGSRFCYSLLNTMSFLCTGLEVVFAYWRVKPLKNASM